MSTCNTPRMLGVVRGVGVLKALSRCRRLRRSPSRTLHILSEKRAKYVSADRRSGSFPRPASLSAHVHLGAHAGYLAATQYRAPHLPVPTRSSPYRPIRRPEYVPYAPQTPESPMPPPPPRNPSEYLPTRPLSSMSAHVLALSSLAGHGLKRNDMGLLAMVMGTTIGGLSGDSQGCDK